MPLKQEQMPQLGSDGLQPHKGGRVLPTQMQTIIQDCMHCQCFEAVLEYQTGFCHMECRSCKALLSPVNLSGTALTHMKSCKGEQDAELAELSGDEDQQQPGKQQKNSVGGSSSGQRWQ